MPFNVSISYGKNLFSTQEKKLFLSNTVDCNIKIKNYLSGVIDVDFLEEYMHILHEGDSAAYIRRLTPTIGAQLQFPLLNQDFLFMPYLNLQGGPEFSNFADLNTEFIIKTGLGARFLFPISKNKLGLIFDTSFNAKIHTKDFAQKDLAFNAALGLAF